MQGLGHGSAKKATELDTIIDWLHSVYTIAGDGSRHHQDDEEGGEVPSTLKSEVYDRYVRFCDRNGFTPTSAAAFGKIVHKGTY